MGDLDLITCHVTEIVHACAVRTTSVNGDQFCRQPFVTSQNWVFHLHSTDTLFCHTVSVCLSAPLSLLILSLCLYLPVSIALSLPLSVCVCVCVCVCVSLSLSRTIPCDKPCVAIGNKRPCKIRCVLFLIKAKPSCMVMMIQSM